MELHSNQRKFFALKWATFYFSKLLNLFRVKLINTEIERNNKITEILTFSFILYLLRFVFPMALILLQYPDGYLEAEAEKKALKEKNSKSGKGASKGKGSKKRALRESNQTTESESEASPPVKKRKTSKPGKSFNI